MAKPGKKSRKVLFAVEIFVLLVFIGGLFVYAQINSKLNKISAPSAEDFDRGQVEMNESAPKLTGYTNVALFALDHRSKNTSAGGENSDTIIIASIDNDTKDVKLVSVYRDTFLDIGDDTYQKCNAAYSYGGPQQALSMLNTNLDMNIQDYVTVDFTAMVKAVDMLGGIDVPLTYQEMVHLNNYCIETSEETDTDYTPLELPDPKPEDETKELGLYHLDGVQATSYCRIRFTASLDFGRTERQRRVIQLMVDKAKKSSIATLGEIMDEVFPYVETSFSKSEILKMGVGMLSYSIDDTIGFPQEIAMTELPVSGSVVIPTTLESNVKSLHQFLFPGDTYTPSQEVQKRSQTIIDLSGYGEGGKVVNEKALSNIQEQLDKEDSVGIQVTPEATYQDPPQVDTWTPTQAPSGNEGWYDPNPEVPPTEPVTPPTEPETPPENPGYPENPEYPDNPENPENPYVPEDPGYPDNPAEPIDPVYPEEPGEPEWTIPEGGGTEAANPEGGESAGGVV